MTHPHSKKKWKKVMVIGANDIHRLYAGEIPKPRKKHRHRYDRCMGCQDNPIRLICKIHIGIEQWCKCGKLEP